MSLSRSGIQRGDLFVVGEVLAQFNTGLHRLMPMIVLLDLPLVGAEDDVLSRAGEN